MKRLDVLLTDAPRAYDYGYTHEILRHDDGQRVVVVAGDETASLSPQAEIQRDRYRSGLHSAKFMHRTTDDPAVTAGLDAVRALYAVRRVYRSGHFQALTGDVVDDLAEAAGLLADTARLTAEANL